MDGFKVLGTNFILNIAQPENTPGGIFVTNRDPRRQRIKLDAYVGIVEEVGAGCKLVEPGMRVVVKRWEYRQHDIDDERLICKERELLILDDKTPAPDVIVMELVLDVPKTNLTLPHNFRPKKAPYHFGAVIAADCTTFDGEKIVPGDILWVERRDSDQFLQGATRFIFKNTPDIWNGSSPILMVGKKTPKLQVV